MPTSEQRSDLRIDLGLTDDETVFTNTAIDRLYARAGEQYTDADVIEAWVRVQACRQLRNQASTLTDYTQNASSERLSQVFANLDKMQAGFERDLAAATRRGMSSLRKGTLKGKPTREKEYPDA